MSKNLILVRHLRVHNANALSSPYTIGFPAMTAIMGASHALERRLNHDFGFQVTFPHVGVVCHRCHVQTYKGEGDFVSSIIGTANPLTAEGERPPFIEEARCHLDISLIFDTTGVDDLNEHAVLAAISQILYGNLKVAGGDIIGFEAPQFENVDMSDEKEMRKFKRRFMPGYFLMERRDLMKEAMREGQDALDALLDYLAIHHRSEQQIDKQGKETVTWMSERKTTGWIVPIATGFQGISPLSQAKNQRDDSTLHRFAESVVTLGEFKMIHRLYSHLELFWHYHTDSEKNLYLCQQLDNI